MDFLKKHLTGYPVALLFALVMILQVYLLFGFFWEDWQWFLINVCYGLICSKPTLELGYQDLLFLQIPILVTLSDWFRTIPVFGIWVLGIIILYTSLWFHLSLRILKRNANNAVILPIIFSHLCVWCIIGISLVYVNVTRDSILFVSGSLLLYLDYYFADGKKLPQLLLLSLLGVSMRVTSGIMAVGAISFFALLVSGDLGRTFHLFKTIWVIAFLTLIVVLFFHPGANEYESKVEKFEYPIMGGALMPMSEMKSGYDSARYEALSHQFLVTDTAKINLEFLKRVTKVKRIYALDITKGNLIRMSETLSPLLQRYRYMLICFYLLLGIVSWRKPKAIKLKIVAFNSFCWLVIIALSIKVTMQMHFFAPWISLMYGGSIVLCLQERTVLLMRQRVMASMILVIIFLITLKTLQAYSNKERLANAVGESYIKHLKAISKDKTLLIWDHYPQLPVEIMARNELSVLKNCIYLSLYTVQFYDFGQERCRQKLGVNPLDWKAMNDTLNCNKERIRFITEDSSAQFLKYYYRETYNKDFVLVKDSPPMEVARDLFVYHLVDPKRNAELMNDTTIRP